MGTSPHPEAELLRRARQARGLSIPAAAEAAGISHQRWGQIERSEGKQAPPETIARMAKAVGVTAVRLAEVRPKAADILEEIELQEAAGGDDFEAKMRAAIERLPAEDRAAVEELYADLMETQERNRRTLEKVVSLFAKRETRSSGRKNGRDIIAGEAAEGS